MALVNMHDTKGHGRVTRHRRKVQETAEEALQINRFVKRFGNRLLLQALNPAGFGPGAAYDYMT